MEWLSTKKAADYCTEKYRLFISPDTIRHWTRPNKNTGIIPLKSWRVGGRVKILLEDLEEFLQRHKKIN